MCNFVVTPAIYSYSYARLLLVGGIDQRLPMSVARLNKNRVPANAIIFQTVVAVVFAVILFIVIPLFGGESNAVSAQLGSLQRRDLSVNTRLGNLNSFPPNKPCEILLQ